MYLATLIVFVNIKITIQVCRLSFLTDIILIFYFCFQMRRKMTIGMFIFKVVLLVCFLLARGGELFQTCHRQWPLSGLEKALPVNMHNMCPKCSKCFVANTKVPWTLKTMPAARSTVTSSSAEVDMTGASTSATVNDDLIPAETS